MRWHTRAPIIHIMLETTAAQALRLLISQLSSTGSHVVQDLFQAFNSVFQSPDFLLLLLHSSISIWQCLDRRPRFLDFDLHR